MYGVSGYGNMLADRPRMRAYTRALRKAVRKGSVVVDIGSGTGIMALLACKFGARRVYAIEPDSAIEVARQVAQANGCADRIVFFQELSTRVELPEPADVIVSDLRGILPLFQHHLPAVADARRRFLKPGGSQIPLRDTLWASVLENPRLYRSVAEPWIENPFDLDLRAALNVVSNSIWKVGARPSQLLTAPLSWATLDYTSCEEPSVGAKFEMSAHRDGTAHGLILWFDSVLARGVEMSNAPSAPRMIYGQMFLPFPEPVEAFAGDRFAVSLEADLVGDDYLWRWETAVHDAAPSSPPRARFQQSTFWSTPLTLADLRKREAGFVPAVNLEGEIERFILSQMDGQTSQEEIARRAQARFPAEFPRWENALTRAGDTARKFSR